MKKITIATHNGQFHPDEVFAVAVLELCLEKDAEITVIRTRDDSIVESADIVVDVGGVYDKNLNRFDHHQTGGAGVHSNGAPYASFGLIWEKYGLQLCGAEKEIVDILERKLVMPIDLGDNGVQVSQSVFDDLYPYTIYDFFDALGPSWKEGKDETDIVFHEVVLYARKILLREIKKAQDKLEARDIVLKIYNESSDKRVIVFDKEYPSNEFLVQFPEPMFSIAPRFDDTWTIKTVKEDPYKFIDRKKFPESWAGKRGGELEEVTGVTGAIFCHKGRFFAVTKTKESALKLAEIALK